MDGECVPQLDGPIGISGGKAAYEMILEGLDGTFCCIYLVVIWFHELPFTLFRLEKNLEGHSCLIVCDIEEGPVPLVDKDLEDALEGGDNGVVFYIRDALRKCVIVVIIICNEEILVCVQ